MLIRLDRVGTARHIQVAAFRDGWTMAEASLDNAQFFHDRADAEDAARNLGERLGAAGDPGEITIRLANGGFGGSFVISNSDNSETLRAQTHLAC
jgi:hypothetical protein